MCLSRREYETCSMSLYAEESKSEIHFIGDFWGGGCARRKALTGNGFTLDASRVGNQFNKEIPITF